MISTLVKHAAGLRSAGLAFIALSALLLSSCHPLRLGPFVPEAPAPPTGTGSVSASVTLSAPVVEVLNKPDDTSSSALGQLRNYPQLGFFFGNFERPAHATNPDMQVPVDLGGGIWRLDLHYADLAFGSYSFSPYDVPYSDLGVPPHWNQLPPALPFSVDAEHPAAAGLTLPVDMGGAAEGQAFSGRFLLSGNAGEAGQLSLSLAPVFDVASSELRDSPTYSLSYAGARHGRVYYRVSGVKGTACGVEVYSSQLSIVQAQRSRSDGHPNLASSLTLSAVQPAPRFDVYAELRAPLLSQDEDAVAAQSGVITCHIHTSGATQWDDDIAVEAVDVSGAAAAGNSHARAWLLSEDLGLNGLMNVELGWLRPGTYKIDVYRLGQTNTDSDVRLGGSSAPVALPLPPLDYFQGGSGHKFYFQPAPAATVDFNLDLAP